MFSVRAKVLILKRPDVYQKKEAKKVFEYAKAYFEPAAVDLVLEDIREIFDYATMIPRGHWDIPKWLMSYGHEKAHGWWDEDDRILQILLIPPAKTRSGINYPVSVSQSELNSRLVIATASPTINTLCEIANPLVSAGAILAHEIAHVFGVTHSSEFSIDDLMDPGITVRGFHSKSFCFKNSARTQMRRWLKSNKFLAV